MLGNKQDSPVYDHPSKTFIGIRFVVLGFDPINAHKARSKLVNGGGVDAGQYGPNCTHVIVDKLVYDDPICVAARTDGKILVTGLWVDHSFDIGMPVDPTSVMYRPLRDLDGIPDARSLIVCLTGYQRQDRDDIMTMVGLMGAKFSKPLVANKVTHLICYKFEGEKYELAKKMKKIKLVNHRWLEDCGYELEMVEAEAKDSEEEETEEIAKCGERKYNVNPHDGTVTVRAHPSPQSKDDISRNLLATSASKGLSRSANNKVTELAGAEETLSVQAVNLQDIDMQHPEMLCSRDTRTLGNVTCGEPSEQPLKSFDITPTSASGSAKRSPDSDAAKLSTMSYSRKIPRRNALSMSPGQMACNLNNAPKVGVDKLNVSYGFEISSSETEQVRDGTESEFIRTPSKKNELHHEVGSDVLPEMRKMNVSYGCSKSQKMSYDPKTRITENPLVNWRTGCLESTTALTNGSLDENATFGPGHHSPPNILVTNFSSFDRKSLPKTVVNAVTSESRREDNLEALQTSFIGLIDTSLASEPGFKDVGNRAEEVVSEVGKPQKELQDVQVPYPKIGSLETEKSYSPSPALSNGKNADSLPKQFRRKATAKKSLGSRPRLGPSNTKNQKGSIHVNDRALQSDVLLSSIGGKETEDREMFVDSVKVEMVPPVANVDKSTVMETDKVERPRNEVENKGGSIDDETEAPDDKEECELAVGDAEKPEEVYPTHMMNILMKDKSEDVKPMIINDDAKTHDPTRTSDEDENGVGLGQAFCGGKNKPDRIISQDSSKEKSTKLKKRLLSKKLRKPFPSITDRRKSKEGVSGEESKSKKNNENISKKEKCVPSPTGKTERTVALNKSENSMEVDKENRPVGIGNRNASCGEHWLGKVASKSNRMSIKIDPKAAGVTDQDSAPAEKVLRVKIEPVWFILSGHKLQRKEFQHVIRRLKGKVCRDSHQWSYQATHFIVPDPIRRTEKFFAAAASGRWILKTDYLTASNQAGRLLAEQPYEWHKNGLSEDGTINLEAPRKWRLLRERTGHGAFYGLRVVIYGECIAPPLDTLKRVIKAGDGTILATSPPYTRFLESGVDFAIVSPGMPRVDMWVQEFLRHEIPCIIADYLVEYICKPGYSLERHVQYNTHTWAERSFANLLQRSEEVVVEPTTPEDCDLPCQVCGSRDRGEVMLICGDESGSTGCGVGMHIDCCDPPLEHVPVEDWFCPKCSESRSNVIRSKSTKKGTHLSKGK
ncbi:hypothetical protein U1Q18_019997 [Sarracenia purpurea var. burkii]